MIYEGFFAKGACRGTYVIGPEPVVPSKGRENMQVGLDVLRKCHFRGKSYRHAVV